MSISEKNKNRKENSVDQDEAAYKSICFDLQGQKGYSCDKRGKSRYRWGWGREEFLVKAVFARRVSE